MFPAVETRIFAENVLKMCKLCNKMHCNIPSVDYGREMHFAKTDKHIIEGWVNETMYLGILEDRLLFKHWFVSQSFLSFLTQEIGYSSMIMPLVTLYISILN